MDKDTLRYALSTLAQTDAALIAFLGAIGLYRLQFFNTRSRSVEQSLRGLASQSTYTTSQAASLSIIQLWAWAKRIADAKPEELSTDSERKVQSGVLLEFKAWMELNKLSARLTKIIIIFVSYHLVTIAASLLGFLFMDLAVVYQGWSWGIFFSLSLGAVLSTFLMLTELTGFLTSVLKWAPFSKIRRWLEKPRSTEL